MNRPMNFLIASVFLTLTVNAAAEADDTVISIQYGIVKAVQTVEKDSKHAGGALAGGVIGALIGPSRHRGLRVAAGAATGAAIEGHATSGTLQQYAVDLGSGGTIEISTEQDDIRVGDCVSIEQGQHANIRRVGSINCESQQQTPPDHHVSGASNCEKAKNELSGAQTDDEVDRAIAKVRTLCED